jgi:pimeloyl-ACP methyl ester carboxylesterase
MSLSIRTVAVSLRGHGDSDKPATGYGVENFSEDVVALLDALHIEQAVLAGHSGSCLVARRIAIDSPERVAGLVLEASPTTLHGDPALQAAVEQVLSGLEDPIDAEFARSFVTDSSSSDVAPALVDQLVREILKVPARVWREVFTGLLVYDDSVELARVTTPVLLIWGDADRVVGRSMQEELKERIPHADLVVYHGVGHAPRWEDPVRFATDIATFVERSFSVRP